MKPKDPRPRFGFCWTLDTEPQVIREKVCYGDSMHGRKRRTAVAVIPLPFMSSKMKARVRAFAKSINP